VNIETIPARSGELATIRNLFVYYIHDLSEFGRWDVDDDGSFGVPAGLANYWGGAEGSRWQPEWRGFPFLIRAGGKLAGFALVKQIADNPAAFDMGEFFILRKFRRAGIGEHVASALFDRYRGRWDVRELPANLPAQKFWRRVIAGYTHGVFTESRETFEIYGAEFVVQRFVSGH
jgi:predicted acetyltransferase